MHPPEQPVKRVDDAGPPRAQEQAHARAVLAQFIRARGLKQSSKRDRILELFLATRDHLSTEELHRIVRAADPGIGYTTVYRTLKLFAQCGLASEVDFQDGVQRYEHSLNRRAHHHMVCTGCGDSVEFFAPEVEEATRRIGEQFRFRPSRHNLQVLGTCERCSERIEQRSATSRGTKK